MPPPAEPKCPALWHLGRDTTMNFSGKRVLVTGSTSGIGRAAAEMFLAAGAQVAINGVSAEDVAAVLHGMGGTRLVAAPGDVSTLEGCEAAVTAAIAGLGGLDCLVNNAGIVPLATFAEVTEAHWDSVINTNLRSAMFCTKFALNALRQSKGNVVMVSSAGALMAGPTDAFVESVSKAGMIGLSRSLALELAADGVRFNCVCPGYIDTPALKARNEQSLGRIDASVSRATPLARTGTVKECASAILYAASEDAGYMTGSTLVADGGCHAQASFGAAAIA